MLGRALAKTGTVLVLSAASASCGASEPAPVDGRGELIDVESLQSWASCAWRKLPITTSNIEAVLTGERDNTQLAEFPVSTRLENLTSRVNLACGDELGSKERHSIDPTIVSEKLAILLDKRPQKIERSEEDISAYICAHKDAVDYLLVERELVRPVPDRELLGTTTRCYRVASDGSLTDA